MDHNHFKFYDYDFKIDGSLVIDSRCFISGSIDCHSPIEALLELSGVHADLASCVEQLFRTGSRIDAAFLLAFLGPVAIVAMTTLGAYHVRPATAARIPFLQLRPAFLAVAHCRCARIFNLNAGFRESRWCTHDLQPLKEGYCSHDI